MWCPKPPPPPGSVGKAALPQPIRTARLAPSPPFSGAFFHPEAHMSPDFPRAGFSRFLEAALTTAPSKPRSTGTCRDRSPPAAALLGGVFPWQSPPAAPGPSPSPSQRVVNAPRVPGTSPAPPALSLGRVFQAVTRSLVDKEKQTGALGGAPSAKDKAGCCQGRRRDDIHLHSSPPRLSLGERRRSRAAPL